MFDKKVQGVNFVQIKCYLYHWKIVDVQVFKMILHS